MTICAACSQALIAGLCFDCELPNRSAAVARTHRCYAFHGAATDEKRLTATLAALVPETSVDDLAWLARRGSFEVVAELSDEEDARLAALLRASAPGLVVVPADHLPPSRALRFSASGRTFEKLGATFVVGGASFAMHVPVVPIAAIAMSALLVARAPRFVDRRLFVPASRIGALLGVLPEDVVAKAAAARASIGPRPLLEAFRTSLDKLAATSEHMRTGGAHLWSPDVAAADAAVTRLSEATIALVVASQNAAPDGPPSATAYRTHGRALEDMVSKLEALPFAAAAVVNAQFRRDAVVAFTARTKQILATGASRTSS